VNREAILRIKKMELSAELKNRLWMERDYYQLLEKQSLKQDKTKKEVSLLLGELGFVHRDGADYEYSDQFGLIKTKGGNE